MVEYNYKLNKISLRDKDKISFGRNGPIKTPLYNSKIIKAGALLSDTKIVLSVWDPTLSVNENLQRIRRQNLLGKTSRSRAQAVLAIFKQRYLAEEEVARTLAILVKRQFNGIALDRILYFHTVRADFLLRDVVLEILVPKRSTGHVDVHLREIESGLKKWVEEGKTLGRWGDYTISRVARGILSTLRDFGVLQGAVKKRIAPIYLPVEAFSYIAFYLKQHQPSGSKLLELPDWKLFFLTREGVERFFFDAHQRGLLEYHVAGSVTRLTFPVSNLEEYANVLTK
jgi:hypothetical protein